MEFNYNDILWYGEIHNYLNRKRKPKHWKQPQRTASYRIYMNENFQGHASETRARFELMSHRNAQILFTVKLQQETRILLAGKIHVFKSRAWGRESIQKCAIWIGESQSLVRRSWRPTMHSKGTYKPCVAWCADSIKSYYGNSATSSPTLDTEKFYS